MTDPIDAPAWIEREDRSTVPIVAACAIGRAAGNQVVIADEKVSRKHALIHRQGDNEYWLVDLGSSNGTYLNGRRLSQPVPLRDGALVQIGATTFRFHQRDGSSETSLDLEVVEGTIQHVRIAPCWLLLADIEGSTELARELEPDHLAMATGQWLSACKQMIESNGGMINKYLGDGFFAYWHLSEGAIAPLVTALAKLKRMQASPPPRFRVVLHHGHVSMGGAPSMGEESLSGPEVNFIFRMEKLAGRLGHRTLMSEAASNELSAFLPGEFAGRHALSGFEGEFAFLTF